MKKISAIFFLCGLTFSLSPMNKKVTLTDHQTRASSTSQTPEALYRLGLDHENNDIERATDYYLQAAEQGCVKSQNNLGSIFEKAGALEEAEHWYRRAAKTYDAAQFNLACFLEENGRREEAIPYYQKAAESGHRDAQLRFGYFCETTGNKPDAEKYYRLAAAQGQVRAEYRLALLLEKVNRTDEAISYYQKAAEKNYPEAQVAVAVLLEKDDPQRAQELLEKASNADCTEAHLKLALLELKKGNAGEAEVLLKKASDKNHHLARYYIARLYSDQGKSRQANDFFKTCNLKELKKIFKKDALDGKDEANYHLGLLYLAQGKVECAKEKLKEEEKRGNIRACCALAQAYGSKPKKAFIFLKRAADKGDPEALYQLAEIYQKAGKISKARELLIRSVKQNYVRAENRLADLELREKVGTNTISIQEGTYESFDSICSRVQSFESENRFAEAEQLLQKVADAGCFTCSEKVEACYRLARMIYKHEGKPWKARKYFERAANQGHVLAYYYLARMYELEGDFKKKQRMILSRFDDIKNTLMKLADTGDVEAQFHLGLLYLDHDALGIACDHFRIASDRGHLLAHLAFTCLKYRQEEHIEGQQELTGKRMTMNSVINIAVGRGNLGSHVKLLQCYDANKDTDKEIEQIIGILADQDDPELLCWLARFLRTRDQIDIAVPLFTKAADKGFVEAQLMLVRIKLQPDSNRIVDNLSEEQVYQHVRQLDAEEQFFLSGVWRVYSGSTRKIVRPDVLVKTAANNENTEAMVVLGKLYVASNDNKMCEQAETLFRHAATPEAHYRLGKLAQGRGEHEHAQHYFVQAAQEGDMHAQYYMGTYEEKRGCIDEAKRWYAKAAEQGLSKAQYAYGIFLKNEGNGHTEFAQRLFQCAAEQRFLRAYVELGLILEQKGDVDSAQEQYELVAQWGVGLGEAHFHVGRVYRMKSKRSSCSIMDKLRYSEAAQKSWETAIEAALGNEPWEDHPRKAFQHIREKIECAYGSKNTIKQLFKNAALQGDSDAQAAFGFICFREGKKAEALKWYEMGEAQGNAAAQFRLGEYYEGEKDSENAKKFFMRAAIQHDSSNDYVFKAGKKLQKYAK
jgi:TPR repeat protein